MNKPSFGEKKTPLGTTAPLYHVSQTFGESCLKSRRNVRTTPKANKTVDTELRRARFLLATGQRHYTEALCHTCTFMRRCCSSCFWSYCFHYICTKKTSFFKRPSGPPTFNRSASGDEDLEPPKNKSLKSGSNRDNSAYPKMVLQWQKNFTINLSYKVVEGPMNLWKKYGVKPVGNFRRTKHLQ